MKRLFLLGMVFLFWNNAAFAEDAASQSCSLEKSLKTGGPKEAGNQLAELMAWNPRVNMDAFNANLKKLYHLEMTSTGTFSFGSIGNFFERFLVIGTAENNSPVYILLNFEKIGNSSRLTNIKFQTGFKKMLKEQRFFGTPKEVAC